MFGWDESCTQAAISHSLGLPPRLIILTDHLQDVSAFKRKPCLLTWRGFVLQWSVIKQCLHVDLKMTHRTNKIQTQWTRKKYWRYAGLISAKSLGFMLFLKSITLLSFSLSSSLIAGMIFNVIEPCD